MPRLGPYGRWPGTVLLLVLGLAACGDQAETPLEPSLSVLEHQGARRAFEVYTQNLFLGGDTGPLFTLDFNNVPAVVAAAATFWEDVQASDPAERVAEIVDEIEHRRPQVVGLQEVLRFIVLNGDFQPIGAIDFLAALEAEIQERGLHYVTDVVQEATSATLPLALDPSVGITQWLNFTDRVVTLRRMDVPSVESTGSVYAASVPLGPFELSRGWARSTVEYRGRTFHFVTTQLETQQAPSVQAAQAAELLGEILAGLDGITVLAGDLNSNAAGEPGDPTWTPTYGELIDGGFIDVWERAPHRRRDQGLTCCHPKSLVGDADFDQRIDFVLARSSSGHGSSWRHRRGLFRADIVGEEPMDRTVSGLWPSDHAGLVASMRLPRARHRSPHR